MRNVYLIRQNYDYMKGDYLVAAVVIAKNEEAAVRLALNGERGEPGDMAVKDKLEVTLLGTTEVTRLGKLGINQPARKSYGVICWQYGEDND